MILVGAPERYFRSVGQDDQVSRNTVNLFGVDDVRLVDLVKLDAPQYIHLMT